MKTERLGPPKGFRLTPKNQERLEYLKELGVQISKLHNEALDRFLNERFDVIVRDRKAALEKVFAAPLP